jgi:hypothetical protein
LKRAGFTHGDAAIRAEQRRLLGGKLANNALAVLEAILDDKDAPFGARVDAAKAIMDRGDLVARKADGGDPPDEKKPLANMSIEELKAIVHRLEAQSEAKPGAEDVHDSEGSD